jgi:acyl-coenzyme A thioesterase 1/2/4
MDDTQPTPETVMEFLGSISLLQWLPSSSLKTISEVIEFKNFNNGEYLVHKGEVGNGVYFICKGEVEVSVSIDSKALRHPKLLLRRGDYFGCVSVKEVHRADVIAFSKVDKFRGITLPGTPMYGSVFGGQLISQALAAASKSVDPRMFVHSLHSYFLRAGDVNLPIIYHIHRIRDGNRISTRIVVAKQRGHELFIMYASFQHPQNGFEHHEPMPSAPDPDMLLSREKMLDSYLIDPQVPMSKRTSLAKSKLIPSPIEIRFCEPYDDFNIAAREPRQKYWLRTRGALSHDQALHRCVAAYASDLIFLETSLYPHRREGEAMAGRSLDHSIWFHKPFKADEWLLFMIESPIASNGCGFTTGRMYTRSGELVVSVAQEGLIKGKMQPRAKL